MKRACHWTLGLLSGALLLASLGEAREAQAPPQLSDFVSMRPATPDEIVVTAPPLPSAIEIGRQARKISQVDGSILREPLARFHSRICPGIIGLPRDMAELIVDRIRFNAERIGIVEAKEEICRPNIIVAFSRDGRAEVEGLARTQGHIFSGLSLQERKELLAATGPVRAWSNTVVRSRHGDNMRGRKNLVDIQVLNVANSHSHIFLVHRRDIESAVVIIDLAAIDGLSIHQIADYVTMRSFARTRPPDAGAAADTILSLFDPEAVPPPGLTPFDLGYLKSLYDSYDSVRAIAVTAGTAGEIRKAAKAVVKAE